MVEQGVEKFFFLQCRIAQDSCGHVPARTSQKEVNKSSLVAETKHHNEQGLKKNAGVKPGALASLYG